MITKCAYCGKEIRRYNKYARHFCSPLHSTLFKIDENKKLTIEEKRVKYNFK